MSRPQTSKLKLYFAIATLIASTVVSLGASALANASLQQAGRTQPRTAAPRFVKLSSVEQLKNDFENDNGKVRLVVLVSPT